MRAYLTAGVGLTAVALAGVAVGVTLTVHLAGWTGTVSALAAPAVPAWVGTADTVATLTGAAAGLAGLAWVALDYTHD